MTKVRIARSEDSRMESMMDESALQGMENDPKALGQMMKKMGKEMGEDVPPEFDDVVDRLEAGQSPEEIESAMPDLGADVPNADDDLP
jgi:Flp pilus assembly protein TadB